MEFQRKRKITSISEDIMETPSITHLCMSFDQLHFQQKEIEKKLFNIESFSKKIDQFISKIESIEKKIDQLHQKIQDNQSIEDWKSEIEELKEENRILKNEEKTKEETKTKDSKYDFYT